MPPKTSNKPLIEYQSLSDRVDRTILSLFPRLEYHDSTSERKRNTVLKQLAFIYATGKHSPATVSHLSSALEMPPSSVSRILRKLLLLSFIEHSRSKRTTNYSLTAKGVIALSSFKEFQSFTKMRGLLTGPKKASDKLAYALLVIGHSQSNKDDAVYATLAKYASLGHNIENVSSDAIAYSILKFHSLECRSTTLPNNYIGVFKEFTTTGFQEILRILLTAMKPTIEDYNWLIEFFNATSEFYHNPERFAYINILSEDPNLKLRLEEYRKNQEKSVTEKGSKMEVTFNIPNSNLEKYATMPPYLKAMIMRLIIEPTQFINRELVNYFFNSNIQK